MTYDSTGRLLATNRSGLFIRDIGGFGGERGPKAEVVAMPSRQPDHVETVQTAGNSALLYRLNGDENPLHADPDMAAMGGMSQPHLRCVCARSQGLRCAGFDRPILHGLCTFGIAGRVILKNYLHNDITQFKT